MLIFAHVVSEIGDYIDGLFNSTNDGRNGW
jgi:hypothetical protein